MRFLILSRVGPHWQAFLRCAEGNLSAINPLRYRGYYYDAETGFYYLQSRYYDPKIGRFINADGYTSTGQGIIGYDVFTYCFNNPLNYKDAGGENAQPIGAGVQFELDIGNMSVGIEVILYWDVDECENGAPVIAVYIYGGVSVDVNNAYIASVLGMITDNASLLIGEDGSGAGVMALAALLGDSFSVSVSGVLIVGNDNFNSTKDYEKSFTSVGVNWGKVRGSIAYSESCTTLSVGVNLVGGANLLPSWGVSKTYYQQIFAYSIPNKSSTNVSNTQYTPRRRNSIWISAICL